MKIKIQIYEQGFEFIKRKRCCNNSRTIWVEEFLDGCYVPPRNCGSCSRFFATFIRRMKMKRA